MTERPLSDAGPISQLILPMRRRGERMNRLGHPIEGETGQVPSRASVNLRRRTQPVSRPGASTMLGGHIQAVTGRCTTRWREYQSREKSGASRAPSHAGVNPPTSNPAGPGARSAEGHVRATTIPSTNRRGKYQSTEESGASETRPPIRVTHLLPTPLLTGALQMSFAMRYANPRARTRDERGPIR